MILRNYQWKKLFFITFNGFGSFLVTIKNRIFAFPLLFAMILTVLTGCASKPEYPGYEDLSFDAGALEYIGENGGMLRKTGV